MSILSAAKLIPKGVNDPAIEGRQDLLTLIKVSVLPMCITDAVENREEYVRQTRQVKFVKRIADVLVRGTAARYKKMVLDKAKEEAKAELVNMLLKQTLMPIISTAITTAISLISTLVVSVIVPLITAGVSAIYGACMFLLTNPVGWAILGIAALSLGGYYLYNKFKKKGTKVIEDADDSGYAPSELSGSSQMGVSTNTKSSVNKPHGLVASNDSNYSTSGKGKAVITQEVADALTTASTRVGVPLNLLTAMAGVESSFKADISASTSSASGLFQFIDSTWAAMKNKYGDQYGIPKTASKSDPVASAVMAAAMMKHEGYPAASKAIGGPASITDIYLTHFMGAAGGAAFLRSYVKNPDSPAASTTPSNVVFANKSIFYSGSTPRSFREIYDLFASRLAKYEARTSELAKTDNQPVTAKAPEVKDTTPVAKNETSNPQAGNTTSPSTEYYRLNKKTPILRVNTEAKAA